MTKRQKILSFIVITSLLAAGIGVITIQFADKKSSPTKQDSLLARTINECDGIAEKSVLALPELLEFQRIEKQGRKARVMQLCMGDRGYLISKQWMNTHHQQAQQVASEQGISEDAALEQIKRAQMYQTSSLSTLSVWEKQN